MDFSDALKAGGASATLILIVAVAVKVLQMALNRRLRSECCGRTFTAGVRVETMSSPEKSIELPSSRKNSVIVEVKEPVGETL